MAKRTNEWKKIIQKAENQQQQQQLICVMALELLPWKWIHNLYLKNAERTKWNCTFPKWKRSKCSCHRCLFWRKKKSAKFRIFIIWRLLNLLFFFFHQTNIFEILFRKKLSEKSVEKICFFFRLLSIIWPQCSFVVFNCNKTFHFFFFSEPCRAHAIQMRVLRTFI